MKDNNLISWAGSALTLITASLSQDVTQMILLIVGILSSLVSLAYTLWKWYRKAKADGKISEDEIDEAMDIVNDHVNKDKNDETK